MGKGRHKKRDLASTLAELDPRPEVGGVPAAQLDDALPPHRVPGARGFAKGNKAGRLRAIKNRARGISSLSPTAVPAFMKPHIEAGVAYAGQLLRTLDDRPVLLPMAGLVADSYTVAKAILNEALRTLREDDLAGLTLKEKLAWLAEAKSWLTLHDRQLTTLTKLQGESVTLSPGGAARMRDRLKEEAKAKADSEAIDAEGLEVEEEVEVAGVAGLRAAIARAAPPPEPVEVVVPAPPPTDPALPDADDAPDGGS